MTDLLITAAEVLETAFPSNEYVPEGMIVPARIETAQLGFLRPVFGKLYDKLGEEPYAAFCRTYIKPALAYYIRYLMVDEQCAAIGAAGIRQNKSAYTEPSRTAGCTGCAGRRNDMPTRCWTRRSTTWKTIRRCSRNTTRKKISAAGS